MQEEMQAKQSGKTSDAFELVFDRPFSGGEEQIRQTCQILDLLDIIDTFDESVTGSHTGVL